MGVLLIFLIKIPTGKQISVVLPFCGSVPEWDGGPSRPRRDLCITSKKRQFSFLRGSPCPPPPLTTGLPPPISGLDLLFPTPCGPLGAARISRLHPACALLETQRRQTMASSMWGLVCVMGLLASGSLGTSPQLRPEQGRVHPARPLVPRGAPRVPASVYQRIEDMSVEQTSDEAPSAESDDTGRGFPRSAPPPGANHLQAQERRGPDSAGWYRLHVMDQIQRRNAHLSCIFS